MKKDAFRLIRQNLGATQLPMVCICSRTSLRAVLPKIAKQNHTFYLICNFLKKKGHFHSYFLKQIFTDPFIFEFWASLKGTGSTGEKFFNIAGHCFGEVRHAPESATGGAVVDQPADASHVILLKETFYSPQLFLHKHNSVFMTLSNL